MIVISNSSPLLHLATIQQLDLIRRLYGQIYIPQAVFDEVCIAGAGQPGASDVELATWIVATPISNEPLLQHFEQFVDAGEAAAMTLFHEMGADLLLLDDRYARGIARANQVTFMGVLGLLATAKNHRIIPAVKPHLDDLISTGFFLSPSLYQTILADLGET